MAQHDSTEEALHCPICIEDDHRAGAHAVHLHPRCARCRDLVTYVRPPSVPLKKGA